MNIYDLMHDSQNEADRNPEAFFKDEEIKIDPALYQTQIDKHRRQFGSFKTISTKPNKYTN